MTQLTTKKLKKLSKGELVKIANQLATRLQWLHSVGKNETNPDVYQRVALELYHVSELIEEKKQKQKQNRNNYGKA